MEAKPYLEEKRRILTERSAEDFVTFLQEVTDQTGNQFIREKLLQNEVRGFRPGRAPLSRTVPILIAKLKSEQEFTNRDSPIWDALTNAWMFWVKSHPKLNEILITFDNGADFDENHNCVIPPNSELDIECFQFLLKASHNTWIHREMIRRFYEYGYFNEDERIQNLINQVPSREEIEQKEQLAELCDKVAELSQAIDRLSQNMEILDYRVSAVESAEELEQRLTEQITDEHRYFDRELQKLERKAAEQHNLLDARLSNAESGYSQLVNLVKRISLLESRISELNVLINSFKDKVSEIESLNRQKISQLVDMRVQVELNN